MSFLKHSRLCLKHQKTQILLKQKQPSKSFCLHRLFLLHTYESKAFSYIFILTHQVIEKWFCSPKTLLSKLSLDLETGMNKNVKLKAKFELLFSVFLLINEKSRNTFYVNFLCFCVCFNEKLFWPNQSRS